MFQCIYTKNSFDESDGEHILQNFLGARWVSKTIVCNSLQAEFGDTIDKGLETGLKEIRTLLGTKGGRGGMPPPIKGVVGATGTKYSIEAGGAPFFSEPKLEVVQQSDGSYLINTTVSTKNQIGWAVAKIKSMFPGADVVIGPQVEETGFVNDRLKISSGLGGDLFFRGALKAVFNMLGATHPDIALQTIFDPVRSFIHEGTGKAEDFARWIYSPEKVELPHIGDFDHFICLKSNGKSVDGYIQFFGEIAFSVRLCTSYSGVDIDLAYQVDPFREVDPAENRSPAYDAKVIPIFDDQAPKPIDAIQRSYVQRFSRILEKYYRRADETFLNGVVQKLIDEKNSRQNIEDISLQIAEYIIHRAGAALDK